MEKIIEIIGGLWLLYLIIPLVTGIYFIIYDNIRIISRENGYNPKESGKLKKMLVNILEVFSSFVLLALLFCSFYLFITGVR